MRYNHYCIRHYTKRLKSAESRTSFFFLNSISSGDRLEISLSILAGDISFTVHTPHLDSRHIFVVRIRYTRDIIIKMKIQNN